MSLYEFDRSYREQLLCGVDEAGRGPLAGPVVAAAVILPLAPDGEIAGINDSKKLSEKKREALYDQIVARATAWSVGVASEQEIDALNILQATFLAMRRATAGLSTAPRLVLVDGNQDPHLSFPSACVVKGDAKSANVAAASILAKVTRDLMMMQLAEEYPAYGFDQHKGYATKLHRERIEQYGPCPIHRKTFLKKITNRQKSTPAPEAVVSTKRGKFGEQMAYAWLSRNGYQMLARNYRSEYGEIDLIAQKGRFLCFIEVKLRAAGTPYYPREAVTLSKQEKIVKTAMVFMRKHPSSLQPRFDVLEVFQTGPQTCQVNLIENAFGVKNEYELF